jgi:hypothetical protein
VKFREESKEEESFGDDMVMEDFEAVNGIKP